MISLIFLTREKYQLDRHYLANLELVMVLTSKKRGIKGMIKV